MFYTVSVTKDNLLCLHIAVLFKMRTRAFGSSRLKVFFNTKKINRQVRQKVLTVLRRNTVLSVIEYTVNMPSVTYSNKLTNERRYKKTNIMYFVRVTTACYRRDPYKPRPEGLVKK